MPPGKTILLVEDTSELLETLRQLLEAHGYRVFCAMSGDVALEILESHSAEIDVLLTDLIMPDMSGNELIASAKKICPHIRALRMSGEPTGAEEPALSAEVQTLNKPFAGRALLEILRQSGKRT